MPYGKINGMKLSLDKSGRLVLPKTLRLRLGVRPGASFEAIEAPDGVLLRPIAIRPSLVEKNGFLVHTGEATHTIDWQELADDLQQERLKDILGR